MPGSDRLRLGHEAGRAPHRAIGEHVVEQHRVDTADQQILVRMHVVVIRHGMDAGGCLGVHERVIGDGARERGDGPAAECGQSVKPIAIGRAHGEHFLELVVGNRGRDRALASGCVFDAAQADVEVAPRDRLVEIGKRGLDEFRRAAERRRDKTGDLDVETDHPIGIARIGFHVGRAALGVTAPAKRWRGGRRFAAGRGADQHDDREMAAECAHVTSGAIIRHSA